MLLFNFNESNLGSAKFSKNVFKLFIVFFDKSINFNDTKSLPIAGNYPYIELFDNLITINFGNADLKNLSIPSHTLLCDKSIDVKLLDCNVHSFLIELRLSFIYIIYGVMYYYKILIY